MCKIAPLMLVVFVLAIARQGLLRTAILYPYHGAVMPSKSPKQARMFAAAAHNPVFAKKVGVPQAVAKEFNKADAKTGILRKKKK